MRCQRRRFRQYLQLLKRLPLMRHHRRLRHTQWLQHWRSFRRYFLVMGLQTVYFRLRPCQTGHLGQWLHHHRQNRLPQRCLH